MQNNFYLDVSKVLEEVKEVRERQKIFELFSKINCSTDEGEIKMSQDFLLLKGLIKEKKMNHNE